MFDLCWSIRRGSIFLSYNGRCVFGRKKRVGYWCDDVGCVCVGARMTDVVSK